ncbi:MAG: sterol desaturase family protein [Proteobacteria bacterium]|nr:sterol desaturase family protein [Pseudomonadota bacterium]
MLQWLQQLYSSASTDALRLGAWLVLLAAIFIPIERYYSGRPQKILRRNFNADLGYYAINGFVLSLLLALPFSAVAWLTHRLASSSYYSWLAEVPLYIRFVAAVIVGELGAYWGHRLMHQVAFLWRFHSIHHSAEEMDWLVNTRAHPLDMAFTRLCGLIPVYLLGLAQPMGNRLDVVPMLYAVTGVIWSYFIHANVRWRFGWMEWLISTPGFHHWHHMKIGAADTVKNYAAIFPWIDKLFGTLYLPRDAWPARYGIDEPTPRGLARQLLKPFCRT